MSCVGDHSEFGAVFASLPLPLLSVELEFYGLGCRRHAQFFEPLRGLHLVVFEETLPRDAKLVAQLARVVSVLGQAYALHDGPSVARHFVELDVAGFDTPRSEALKQALETEDDMVLLGALFIKVKRMKLLLLAEVVVGFL